jgi:serine/threonine protein kinase/regulation of enolase protein 1 (concanavalin A-like superfamily)
MSTPTRPEDRQPSGLGGGAAHPDATIEYIPKDAMSPPGSARGESNARSGPFDFLDPPRAPGELGWLAHYRVRRLLGEGGMGLVFESQDTNLLRPVALKVIRPELAGSTQAAQRFLLEARAMASLKHDHIVTIYQVGQERGVPFLAMEYLQGMSLFRWLERGRTPSLDLVLRLGREMAAGLAAAHNRGLIHRDIKPANIWLEAPIGRVKILDFGLVRSEAHDLQITNPGMTVGTPAYMAPEQARGEGVAAAGDLFSLGCVLYQLCTGALPFSGTTVMAVLTSLSVDTPTPARDLNPAMPPALDGLVMQLLAKDPAERPASAEVVVQTIKSIERELLAERQKAELSLATPLPAVVDSTRSASTGIAGKPGAPRLAAKARRVRRALGIASAVVLLGTAAVSLRLAMSSRAARPDVAVHPVPAAVAAIEPSRAVPEPGPTPSPPAPIAPPKRVAPPADPKPMVREPPRGEKIAAAPRNAMPDPDQPHREVPVKPETRAPVKSARTLANWGDVTDPDEDCQVLMDKEMQRAAIAVPGTAHLLSAEQGRMNAPRVLRDITGDFEVRVRVTGTSHPGGTATTTRYNPYHGAGILVWQDPENYVRLEIAADLRKGKVFSYANFELRQAGRLAVSWGLKIVDGSSYLRLERRGDVIRGSFSPDGDHWTPFSPMIVDLKDSLKVGVLAVNSASKPLKAGFADFRVTGKPNSQADGDRPPPGPPKRSRLQKVGPAPPGTSGGPDHPGAASVSRMSSFRSCWLSAESKRPDHRLS